jgi:hypothetical protein
MRRTVLFLPFFLLQGKSWAPGISVPYIEGFFIERQASVTGNHEPERLIWSEKNREAQDIEKEREKETGEEEREDED